MSEKNPEQSLGALRLPASHLVRVLAPLAALFGAFLCVLPSLAQRGDAPRETFRDETTTLVVEVPVEVTLDGKPLRGLGPENFEITDGGDRMEIQDFEIVDLAEITTSPDKPRRQIPVVARRHFLLLFDMTFASPAAIAKAQESAIDLVETSLHSEDLVSIATYSSTRGAKLHLGFTPDRKQVALAIAALSAPELVERRADPLGVFVGTPFQDTVGTADFDAPPGGGDGGGGGGREGGPSRNFSSDIREHLRDIQQYADRKVAAQGRREIVAMSRSMGELAGMMRAVDGRKHVVYFSEGFDQSLLFGTTDERQRQELNRNREDQAIWRVDSESYFGSTDTLNDLEDMLEEFRRSDCTVHSVDIGGVKADGESRTGEARGRDALFYIADATGGDLFENFNDLGAAMDRLLERTSVTYLLTFSPSDIKPNGKWRKLKVKLRDVPRGARITHRPGYFAPDEDADAEEDAIRDQLSVAQRLFDEPGGEIDTSVLAAALPSEDLGLGARSYVPVLVEIDGTSFLSFQGPTENEARAEIFLYAIDAVDGSIRDFYTQTVTLDRSKVGPLLEDQGFKLYAPLALGPGDYTVRALVRNTVSQTSGLALTQVHVPARDAASSLLPPLVPEAHDAWLLIRGRRDDLGIQEPAYPFFYDQITYVPAASPAVHAGQAVPVFLAGRNLGDIASLTGMVYDVNGREVAEPRWQLDPRSDAGTDGLDRRIAALEIPGDLAPGRYTVQVEAHGTDVHPARVAFEVVPSHQTPSQLLAFATPTQFEAAAEQARNEEMERALTAEDEMEMDALAKAYRKVLAGLSASGQGAAVLQLSQYEAQALGDNPERRQPRLTRTELQAAKKLASRDLEALVPVLTLHQELYLDYKRTRRPWLAFHSRQMVRELADYYAREGRTEGSKVVAARALASLGGHLQAEGRSNSVDLFEQAVSWDPTNEAALLGLASFYEKRGGPYENVVDHLQDLVEHRPDSREGRLRLAINLLRTAESSGNLTRARQRNAEEHLRALLDGPEADWISSLASQELARHLAATRRLDQAIEILQTALEAQPDDQKLVVQLAFLYDRARRSYQSRQLAERLSGELAAPGPVPRGVYNRWPTQALAADRFELQNGARQRLPLLASAVGTVAGGEGE